LIEEFLDENQVFVTGDLDDDDYDDFELAPIENVETIYKDVVDYLKDRDGEGLGETIKNTLLGINAFAGGDMLAELLEQFDLKEIFSGEEDGEGD
jgi:hypothetical protein